MLVGPLNFEVFVGTPVGHGCLGPGTAADTEGGKPETKPRKQRQGLAYSVNLEQSH